MEVMVEKVWNPSQEKPAAQSLSALKTVRVAVYARVSTDQEIQQSSLAEQMKAFRAKIAEHPGWVMVDVYAEMLTTTLIQMHPTCTQTAP